MLDDQSIYRILCVVSHKRGSCPPRTSWSYHSVPFRLASFYDPQGTKNHTVSITLPDLRALEAQANSGIRPSGVQITSPAGSYMSFSSDLSNLKAGQGSVSNKGPVICTFAIELFMIVAMFVFKHLYLTAGLYAVFIGVCWFAFLEWRRDLHDRIIRVSKLQPG